jgi:hypothetical protein
MGSAFTVTSNGPPRSRHGNQILLAAPQDGWLARVSPGRRYSGAIATPAIPAVVNKRWRPSGVPGECPVE